MWYDDMTRQLKMFVPTWGGSVGRSPWWWWQWWWWWWWSCLRRFCRSTAGRHPKVHRSLVIVISVGNVSAIIFNIIIIQSQHLHFLHLYLYANISFRIQKCIISQHCDMGVLVNLVLWQNRCWFWLIYRFIDTLLSFHCLAMKQSHQFTPHPVNMNTSNANVSWIFKCVFYCQNIKKAHWNIKAYTIYNICNHSVIFKMVQPPSLISCF